jgi:hypothetical protein
VEREDAEEEGPTIAMACRVDDKGWPNSDAITCVCRAKKSLITFTGCRLFLGAVMASRIN